MATVTIDGQTIESVSVSDAESFETLRQEFNSLSTDTLAERYDISPSFINDDGSFDQTAREELLVDQDVDLIAKVAALQSLRNTEESKQLDERIETNIGDTVGGVSPERAKELQEQRVEQQARQERDEARRRAANQTPKLQEIDAEGTVISEIKPDVVTRFGGTKPFDSDSTQLQDGQTVTDQRGDTNVRVNMEMVLTHSEFVLLNEISNTGNRLRVVSSSYKGPATFDQLKFDRIPDSNGQVTPNGATQNALYTVQLQSKEQSEEDDTLIQPFTED
jgi:hypothetical protein